MTTSSGADADPAHGEVAALRLRLTHSGGEVRSGALRIPVDGAGMSDALALSGERYADAQWPLANLCRIQRDGGSGRWQLLNLSHTLLCVRNGQRVPPACPVPVSAGDVLELGLLRFVVEPWDDFSIAHEPASAATPAARIVTPAEDPAPGFDWHDLAGSPQDSGVMGASSSAPIDPFVLLGIAGVQSRSTADVLSALLGESPQPERRAMPAVHTERSPSAPGGPAALLDELHDEFVRVVRDPDQLAGRTDWEGIFAIDGEPAPTLDELSKQAEPYPLLRDIVLQREGIDCIIDGFEPLERSSVLDTPHTEDVLSLFAPELARDAQAVLPSLTRREHHELSPDSHVRIGTARSIPNGRGSDSGSDKGGTE
ncbi:MULTISPECIES: TagK domain-containing protein [unclassified Variovorax]|uniref:TagK domain-containing protein n=1 Tax=unclassified Variovorax TaxID=663243 RepID=UPI003F457D47